MTYTVKNTQDIIIDGVLASFVGPINTAAVRECLVTVLPRTPGGGLSDRLNFTTVKAGLARLMKSRPDLFRTPNEIQHTLCDDENGVLRSLETMTPLDRLKWANRRVQ